MLQYCSYCCFINQNSYYRAAFLFVFFNYIDFIAFSFRLRSFIIWASIGFSIWVGIFSFRVWCLNWFAAVRTYFFSSRLLFVLEYVSLYRLFSPLGVFSLVSSDFFVVCYHLYSNFDCCGNYLHYSYYWWAVFVSSFVATRKS